MSRKSDRSRRSARGKITRAPVAPSERVARPGLPTALKQHWLTGAAVAALLISLYVLRLVPQDDTPLPGTGDAADHAPHYISGRDAGYLPGDACKDCHADIYETYQHTGMGRSFNRLYPGNVVENFDDNNVVYHKPSDRYYRMIRRDGRYYQRRHQIGVDGEETNIVEKPMDYVVGSGNHSRTYLHQTASGGIVELPVAWYSAGDGYWAMNPGYDRFDHDGFRRRVTYECMFCHNGYPELPPDSDLSGSDPVFPGMIPNGIDCQRCHGPGRAHVDAAGAGRDLAEIRETIVNPRTLDAERRLEVCLQCHLETTSQRLPNSLRRFDRGVFSYRPGERLAAYRLHFDHAPGTGHDNKFEIAHQGYRLRKSACFQQSGGRLTCTTCHDPHRSGTGESARRPYIKICLDCHQHSIAARVQAGLHTASDDCLTCHMPKRRTEDVVHVVMTDHHIQRRKPTEDLLAPLNEGDRNLYAGEVRLYYPPDSSEVDELYLAVAQVKHHSNLMEGIDRLEKAIERYKPARAEFYFELAKGYSESGRLEEAVLIYEQALRRDSDYWPALHRYGLTLARLGRLEQSADALERARESAPTIATLSNDLGLTYLRQNRLEEAVSAFRDATAANPDFSDGYNNLGGALKQLGDIVGAEHAFREAIRHQPDSALAHDNLAMLLLTKGNVTRAEHYFRRSIEADGRFAPSRIGYGRALLQQDRYSEALEQLNIAVDLDPQSPQANAALGDAYIAQGEMSQAISYYRRATALRSDYVEALIGLGIAFIEQGRLADARQSLEAALAVKPDEMEARFHLGRALAMLGLREQASVHLRQAASSSTLAIRQAALEVIETLNRSKHLQ